MNTLYNNFHRFAEHEYPVYVACQITNPTYDKKGNLNKNNFVFQLFQKEVLVADFTSSIQIYAPDKYKKIRKRMKRELER